MGGFLGFEAVSLPLGSVLGHSLAAFALTGARPSGQDWPLNPNNRATWIARLEEI